MCKRCGQPGQGGASTRLPSHAQGRRSPSHLIFHPCSVSTLQQGGQDGAKASAGRGRCRHQQAWPAQEHGQPRSMASLPPWSQPAPGSHKGPHRGTSVHTGGQMHSATSRPQPTAERFTITSHALRWSPGKERGQRGYSRRQGWAACQLGLRSACPPTHHTCRMQVLAPCQPHRPRLLPGAHSKVPMAARTTK